MSKLKLMFLALLSLVLTSSLAVFGWSQTAIAQEKDAAAGEDDWDDWDDFDEGEEEEDAFGNILQVSYAVFEEIKVEGAPAANQPAKVTARIKFEDDTEEATISKVEIVYSVNGGAEQSAAMTDGGAGTWSGQIPGQAAGAKVDYYIKVTDTNNNVTSGALPTKKVATVDDIDNSVDIIQSDDADILGVAASYDAENLYVDFNVQGKVDGGTVDPPYIRLYGIKITNPDTEDTEGLLVGKLWAYLPLVKQQEVQEKFMPLLLDQAKDYMDKIGKENIDHVMKEGQIVLDIGKLMSGNTMEGLLFAARPTATVDGGKFFGTIKRAPLGENPSGFYRIIVLTLANASLDSFMPIPLNCSNFLTLYTKNESYTVK